eukprot:391357-Pyramimonas_sp.AAC.1
MAPRPHLSLGATIAFAKALSSSVILRGGCLARDHQCSGEKDGHCTYGGASHGAQPLVHHQF